MNAADREPLRLLPRVELRRQVRRERGTELVLISDPVRDCFWYMRPRDWYVWEQLQPERSLHDLKQLWEARFAPERISIDSLQRILTRLLRGGLISGPPQNNAEQTRSGWLRLLRWDGPGLTPTRLCRILVGPAKALKNMLLPITGCVLVLLACWAVSQQGESFVRDASRLLQPTQYFGFILWAVVWSGVKIIHETGHLLAAVACGVRVQRIGVVGFGPLPTLLCTINAAWEAPRSARLIINAAGMTAELLLAAIAGLLWSACEPGLTRDLLLQLCLWCGVNTLLINGNPLFRFDGYYLLSDALQIPNLAEQARYQLLRAWRFVCGIDTITDPPPLQEHSTAIRWGLLLYAVLSPLARWFAMAGLIWWSAVWLQPTGWVTPTRILGGLFVMLMLIPAGIGLQNILKQPNEHGTTFAAPRRMGPKLAVLLMAVLLLLTPLPRSLQLPILWRSEAPITPTVTVPGRVNYVVPYGSSVTTGQVLVKLESPELKLRRLQAAGERQVAQLRVEQLERRQNDPLVAGELSTARSILRDTEARLLEIDKQTAELEIVAAQSGRWLPPRARFSIDTNLDETGTPRVETIERQWDGLLDEPRNHGVWLDTGVELGIIGATDSPAAWSVVDQAELAELTAAVAISLRVNHAPGRDFSARINETAVTPLERLPTEWHEALPYDVLENSSRPGELTSRSTRYAVEFTLLAPASLPPWNSIGTARVSLPSRSIAGRFWNWWSRTFAWSKW